MMWNGLNPHKNHKKYPKTLDKLLAKWYIYHIVFKGCDEDGGGKTSFQRVNAW